jgi:hypothetical protein
MLMSTVRITGVSRKRRWQAGIVSYLLDREEIIVYSRNMNSMANTRCCCPLCPIDGGASTIAVQFEKGS